MNEHTYRIRPAIPADVAHLAAIERAAATLFSPEVLPLHLRGFTVSSEELAAAQKGGRLWVACKPDDHPVGFAIAQVFGNVAYLQELDVRPEHGRRGLGRRLVERVIGWAASQGYREVLLDTFRNVPWNMPFYARMGFVELRDDEVSETVRKIMQRTFDEGLDPTNRVAMAYRIG